MSKLSVKTKANSSPQGKARVYFSCHPEDLGKCFDTLCADIFQTQNCAIYYESDWAQEAEPASRMNDVEEKEPTSRMNDVKESEPTSRMSDREEAELASQLSDMQLFIVPLTTKFLFHPCRAREYEYGFAMRHHIPILPIAMEEGIDRFFAECMNKVGDGFGDIQFLNKVSKDNTEIPYAEKLERQLKNILTGDELAERVRAAFDAYIFLSYRKKDRVCAKELMKLIHRIPYCRDIAIWYDEFLVPGEGWNAAIMEAMAKSKLVTLAVTPSVVEEDNFIIKHEYPDARKAGKEVIPAEMIPTDREALTRLFKDIPEPVDGTDVKTLEEALKSIAVQASDHVPEHNFLIGLAYLGAIDVERDPQRAVEMITSAAEAEKPVTEAIEKLVSMYNTGEGVERNYLTAVEWQEKLIQTLERTKEDPLSDRDIVSALWDAGDMWQALGRLDQAGKSFSKMMDQARQREEIFHSPSTKRDLSISYGKLGSICSARGDMSGAREYCEKVLRLSEELAEETGTIEARRDLSISYNNLGDICSACGDVRGAREYYEKARHMREAFAEETGTAEARRDLFISYHKLGDICSASGDVQGAREYYEKDLHLSEVLAEETGTAGARRDLAISYSRLGDICFANGDVQSAHEYYEKDLHLSKALADETGTVEARRDLSVSYNNLGDLCSASGDERGARECYEKARHLSEALAEETGTVEARRNLIISYVKSGDICSAGEDVQGAREYYEKARHLSEVLAEETGTVIARRDLATSYDKLGSVCSADGDIRGAREYYEKALHLSEALAEETGTVEARRDLSISYNKLGDTYAESGDERGAQEYYEKSLHLSEALAEETGTVEACEDLAVACFKTGAMGEGDFELLRKAYEIYCKLAEACPDVVRYSTSRDIIGRILKSQGDGSQ